MDGNFWGGRKNIRGYTWTRCVRRSLFENANMLLFLLENCQERVKNPNDFNFSIQSSLSLFLSQSAKNIPFFGVGKRVAAINRHRSWREFASNLVPSLSLSLAILAMRKSARKNNRWSIRRKKFVARLIRHDMNHVPILWIIASNFPTDHRLCIFFSKKETASRINRDSTNFVLSN